MNISFIKGKRLNVFSFKMPGRWSKFHIRLFWIRTKLVGCLQISSCVLNFTYGPFHHLSSNDLATTKDLIIRKISIFYFISHGIPRCDKLWLFVKSTDQTDVTIRFSLVNIPILRLRYWKIRSRILCQQTIQLIDAYCR